MGSATTDAAPPAIAPAFGSGTLIAGRYRLESKLGAGGGGAVWRCIDEKLDAVVALKIVSADGDLERWRREVTMARRIADRNVCRVHDLGEAEGVRFVTMELVEGVSLRRKTVAELPAGEARDLLAQVVSGVAAIHDAGVVHRDLKPDNIVVDADGRAVIVDFGLARAPRLAKETSAPARAIAAADAGNATPIAEAATLTAPAASSSSGRPVSTTVTGAGAVVGTPRYMSPEQAAGGDVDARTDVWALGLIGHELLTGTLPVLAEDGGRSIDAKALTKWPRVAPILRRCLAVDAAARYPDARALHTALLRARRGRLRTALLVLAIVLIAAGSAIAFAVTRDAKPEPIVANTGPVQVTQLLKPDASPASVALAPDGTHYAYTTTLGRLFVTPVAGGQATEWKLPAIDYRAPGQQIERKALVSVWLAGWFADRSLAIVATSEASTWHLLRIYADGKWTELYSTPDRFTAAAAGDVAVVGVHGSAMYLVAAQEPFDIDQIATIGNGELVMALAISPDGKRIAVARLPAGAAHETEATIQVMSRTGDDTKLVWRGKITNAVDQVLGWLDANRIVFAHRGAPTTTLYVHDVRTKQTTARHEWKSTYLMPRPPGIVGSGAGTAARGELLLLETMQHDGLMIGDANAENLRRMHAREATGGMHAGWTTDGRIIFMIYEGGTFGVVRAKPDGTADRWPNLEGVIPNTMVGDDVLVHRPDKQTKELVVERISPSGAHTELHRMAGTSPGAYTVRCAGDRAAPCFIEERSPTQATWRAFDPTTGKVGAVLHKRQLRERSSRPVAALSPDGKTIAIVESTNELFLVEPSSETVRTIDAGDGVDLQSVAFGPSGELWVAALGYRGRRYAILVFPSKDGRIVNEPAVRGDRDTLRFYWRPTPSPDGKHVAVQVKELLHDVSRVSGL